MTVLPTLIPTIEITLVFAALFGILHVLLTARVGQFRFQNTVSLGDGGDTVLLKRIRGHANFTENVPIGLLLLLLNELNGLPASQLITLASVFLLARVAHYFSIVLRLPFVIRPLSMVATLLLILIASILLIV